MSHTDVHTHSGCPGSRMMELSDTANEEKTSKRMTAVVTMVSV